MNLDDLKEMLEDILVSDFRITTDKRGQLVIYTGLIEDSSTGELVSLEDIEEDYEEDEDDEEEDADFGFDDDEG